MKAGWKVKPLGDVCNYSKKKYKNSNLAYVGMEDISSGTGQFLGSGNPCDVKSTTFEFDQRHVLYGRLRPYLNKVLIPNFAGHCSTEVFPILPCETLDKRYLFHWLTSELTVEAINATCTGARMPRANMSEVRDIPIPLPPLDEQKRIVAVLDAAFDGLTRARANVEANLQNARELFESYLGSIFDDPNQDWKIGSVGSFVNSGVIGKPLDGNHGEIHPKKADFVESGVPFIMASDLKNGVVDQENCYFISAKQANGLRKGFAKNGDILLSHKGTIGRTAKLNTKLDYLVLTPQVTYYRVVDKTELLPTFLYFYFQSATFKKVINEIAGIGSTRAYIGITRQLDLPMSFPKIDEQLKLIDQFSKVQSASRTSIAHYQSKLADLDELRQSLLQKAFAGELT